VDAAQEQMEHKKNGNHAKISTAKYVEQVERFDQGDEFSAGLPVLLEPVGIRTLGENRSQKKKNPQYGEEHQRSLHRHQDAVKPRQGLKDPRERSIETPVTIFVFSFSIHRQDLISGHPISPPLLHTE
jgi:hypothetical protein